MNRWGRVFATGAAIVGMAAALLVVGSAAGSPPDGGTKQPGKATQPPATDALTRAIAGLQAKLKASPANDRAWADLGLAYVQQARLTADPSYYRKAEGAFTKSLSLHPTGNTNALTGRATLAAAQHNFSEALAVIDQALAINSYSATAYGVKTDALTELGRYDDAAVAVQRMLDLRPGVDSFARASYQRELRGDVDGAHEAMQRAADDATSPADQAFALYYLGELEWNAGNRAAARRSYDDALAADPDYLPAVTGQAKALAADDATAALSLYREAVQRQPQPAYVAELGELLQATGQTKAAQEQYAVVRATEQLFAASGANVDLELALFEADHGSATAALTYATAAFRDRPDSILAEDAYGWALHAAGRDREALVQCRRAQRLGTKLPVLRYHLGVVEAALGDKAAARRDLTAALALNPAFNPLQAPAARELLRTLR